MLDNLVSNAKAVTSVNADICFSSLDRGFPKIVEPTNKVCCELVSLMQSSEMIRVELSFSAELF